MRDELRRLAKGSTLYGLGGLLPKTLGFVLIPIYTRYLTPREYGVLVYVGAIYAVLSIVMEMGQGQAVQRFYFEKRDDPEGLRSFLGSVQLFLFGANLVLAFLLVVFGDRLFFFSSIPFRPLLLIAVATAFFSISPIVPLWLFRARERAAPFVGLQIGYFVAVAGAIILAVAVWRLGVLGALEARLYVTVGYAVLGWALVAPRIRFRADRKDIGDALRFGLPLVPMDVANWILTFSDRVLLERMTTLEQVGLYSLGYTIGMVMADVVRSIHKAYLPYFLDIVGSDSKAPRTLATMGLAYVTAISAIALFGVLFAREGVMLLAAKSYHGAARVVPYVIVGYLIHGLYYLCINPLYYLKQTGILSVATVVAAAVNVGLNLLWIPRFGMMGAAYATVAAYLVPFLLVFAIAQRRFPIPYDFPKIAIVLLLFACAAAAGLAPAWQGIVVPAAVKTLILGAFGGGLLVLRVVRWRDVTFLFSRSDAKR